MSNNPPEKKASEIILEKIAELDAKITATQSQQIPQAQTTSNNGHKSVAEMLDCPECGKEVRKQVLKEYGKSLKGEKIVKCKECGLPVREEEEKCPLCGGTETE